MIKSTGIVRRADNLGRIVIPTELREKLGIGEKDPIEIFVNGSSIILRKYQPNCIFCGVTKKLVKYNDKLICNKCIENLRTITEKEEAVLKKSF